MHRFRSFPGVLVCAVLACGVLVSPALTPTARAGGTEPADPQSQSGAAAVVSDGRDPANYPPDRHFDFGHLTLRADFGDMTAPEFSATASYSLAANGSLRTQVRLNARSVDARGNGIRVSGVRWNGRTATFTHESDVLLIDLPRPAKPGAKGVLEIAYTCSFPANAGNGLTWSPGKPDAKDLTAQVPMIHSQGQPEENRRWIPIHDFPNERLTSEFIVSVPDRFEVCSNGRLLSQTPDGKGRTTWHWLQAQRHAPYLIMLAVGDFGRAELGGPDSERPGIPMTIWASHADLENARKVTIDTPAMVAFYEAYFDEAYPWDKYDQVVARDFRWGGMENTSATIMYPEFGASEPGSEDDLIAHELAHQWTGDLITCKSWEHIWLNEGWASYSEALWREWNAVRRLRAEQGAARPVADVDSVIPENMEPEARAAARKAYQRAILGQLSQQRVSNRTFAPDAPGMASRLYPEPDFNFLKTNNPYSKGTIVLHMLRQRLGNATFIKGVRLYIDRFRDATVETDDFRLCLEEVSGQSLERFFDQWVKRPGLPNMELDFAWDEASKSLSVTVEQTQKIDRLNPAYALVVPIYVKFADSTSQYLYLSTDVRTKSQSFSLPSRPEQVSVDPGLTTGSLNRVRTPLDMAWRRIISPVSEFDRLLALADFRDVLWTEYDAIRALAMAQPAPLQTAASFDAHGINP